MAAILGLALVSVSAVVYNASVPISSQEIAGYVQLTNNGIPGPCRGDSPTDNDRERWQPNVIATETIDCEACASLCAQNVNITGYPQPCVAFECSPSLADNIIGSIGRRCELWHAPANFVGASSCASVDDETCTVTPSGYHCYVKIQSPPPPLPFNQGASTDEIVAAVAAAAATATESASSNVEAAVVLGVMCLILLLFISILLGCNLVTRWNPAPMTKFVQMQDQNQIELAKTSDATQASEAQTSKLESSKL